jgi:hypothetical protein
MIKPCRTPSGSTGDSGSPGERVAGRGCPRGQLQARDPHGLLNRISGLGQGRVGVGWGSHRVVADRDRRQPRSHDHTRLLVRDTGLRCGGPHGNAPVPTRADQATRRATCRGAPIVGRRLVRHSPMVGARPGDPRARRVGHAAVDRHRHHPAGAEPRRRVGTGPDPHLPGRLRRPPDRTDHRHGPHRLSRAPSRPRRWEPSWRGHTKGVEGVARVGDPIPGADGRSVVIPLELAAARSATDTTLPAARGGRRPRRSP